ncbi:hypothetical protein T265_08491 [Opisthorchis viverrini]|uniref:Uncharacterized protein n=1 Tax=Opisthorchis viverrini TaxID=6198 RepID=A0A075A8B1_OPIVI|nr:hypothetical protein T265_08491 [Opisthorchis viverrini]KER23684.1 hypothetical protein T265_08491 [Opisthorchis viverrini]
MCFTRPPHISLATIFEISRYMYIHSALLIRLLRIRRQRTTGFVLLGAHQTHLLTFLAATTLIERPEFLE